MKFLTSFMTCILLLSLSSNGFGMETNLTQGNIPQKQIIAIRSHAYDPSKKILSLYLSTRSGIDRMGFKLIYRPKDEPTNHLDVDLIYYGKNGHGEGVLSFSTNHNISDLKLPLNMTIHYGDMKTYNLSLNQ